MSINQITQQDIFQSLVVKTNERHAKYNPPGALFLYGKYDPDKTFHLESFEERAKIVIVAKSHFCVRQEIAGTDLGKYFFQAQQKLGKHPLQTIIITAHSQAEGDELCFDDTPNGIYHTPQGSDFSLFTNSAEKIRVFLCCCSAGRRGRTAEKMVRIAPRGMTFYGPTENCGVDIFFPGPRKTLDLAQFKTSQSVTLKYYFSSKTLKVEHVSVKPRDIKEYFRRANQKEDIFQFMMTVMYRKGIIVKKSELKFLQYLNACVAKSIPIALLESVTYVFFSSNYPGCGLGKATRDILFKAAERLFILHDNYGPGYRFLKKTLDFFCKTISELILSENFIKGVEILREAALRNYASAYFYLGNIYFEGKAGIDQDNYEAIRYWFYASHEDSGLSRKAYTNILTLINNPNIQDSKALIQFFKNLNLYHQATLLYHT